MRVFFVSSVAMRLTHSAAIHPKSKYYIWDILEIDWSEVKVTFNEKVINLPKSIMVRLWENLRIHE